MRVKVELNGVTTELQYDAIENKYYADIEAPEESSILLDDVYYSLYVIAQSDDNVASEMIPLYVSPDFIYDRTQADVNLVKKLHDIGYWNMTDEQKELWKTDLKGALNESDLQRIEDNIYGIANLLEVSLQFNRENIPKLKTVRYFTEMLINLNKLKEGGRLGKYVSMGTPATPEHQINLYWKINAIEKILFDLWHFKTKEREKNYCGEVYAGELY